MSFLRFKQDTESTGAGQTTLLAVLILVIILVVLNVITHLPMLLMSLFIQVQHPLIYKFPQYGQLLKEAVKGDYVDYNAIKKSKLLDEAIADLGRTSPDSLEDDEQRFCFWINSYNLLALKSIADKYPVEQVNDPKLSRMGTIKYFIGGKPCSLEEIRKLELYPREMVTPLTAFLTCDGSVGGPPLPDHVIIPKNLMTDAEAAARKYVLKKENVFYDGVHKAFMISPWFQANENLFAHKGGSHQYANALLPERRQLDLQSRDVLFQTFAKRLDTTLNDTELQPTPEESQNATEQKTK